MSSDPMIQSNHKEGRSGHLEPFFSPEYVVVIGACPKPGNLGWCIIESLKAQGFPGKVVAIHPKFPKTMDDGCRSIDELQGKPDLAIAAVSAEATVSLIEPLALKGTHHMIAVSGGFAEAGNCDLQEEMKTVANQCGVRIVGPNGLGIFSAPDRFNSFFLSPTDLCLPKPGSIALISQSGAFLALILNQLEQRGVGVHRAINFGNRVDVGECDALEAFGQDPQVRAIGIYLESFHDGERFFEQVQAITPNKPVLIYKGGKSQSGCRATQAHSASLAGSYPVFQAICRQTGMVEILTLNELVDGLQLLAQPASPLNDRLLIVSNGGGMGVLLTDLCEHYWRIEPPSTGDQDQLRKILPEIYSLANPIDLTGSGTNHQCIEILRQLLPAKTFDALLLVLLPGTSGITMEMGRLLKETLPSGFPVVVGACGNNMYDAIRQELSPLLIPVYPSGEQAAQAMNLLIKVRPRSEEESSEYKSSVDFDPDPLKGWLPKLSEVPGEMELKSVLERCGVPFPRRFHPQRDNLQNVAREAGFPLVLKVNQPDLLHKTESKAVQLDIADEETLIRTWKEMDDQWPGNVWVEEQFPAGLDIMVGFHRDDVFGIILVLGTGGEYAEIYKDVERMRWPASIREVAELFQQTHAGRIACGVHGKPPLNTSHLYAFIAFLAEWMQSETAIRSLDFNPVRLYNKGIRVLDAKLTVNMRGDL